MSATKDADYSKMTDEDFDRIFNEIASRTRVSEILTVGDISSDLREEWNNQILEQWANEHPELAYPNTDTDDDE
jgi:hypothetical protein